MTLMHGANRGIESVSKALEVLCCFSSDHDEWGVTELADYLGLCKSAAHRILVTCEDYGFVERTPSRRYRLGLRVLELGNNYRLNRALIARAEPFMRRLAEHTQSVVHLAQLDGREVLELTRSSGPNSVIFTRSPSVRMPAHSTALGKALLASAGEAYFRRWVGLQRTFKRITPFTIITPEQLWQDLQRVSQKGYSVSDQECALGCRCFAVPIWNRSKQVVAALSISNTIDKFSPPLIPDLLHELFGTAGQISKNL